MTEWDGEKVMQQIGVIKISFHWDYIYLASSVDDLLGRLGCSALRDSDFCQFNHILLFNTKIISLLFW